MLTFGIRYLNGFAAASLPDDRERAEWPPHPGRVFMALAAAHFETGADPAERDALEWLEALEQQPNVRASEGSERALVTQYVPVNDRSGPSTALMRDLSLTRTRQERPPFARTHLEDEVVYISWPSADLPPRMEETFERLCLKVTRIGHSSSLVQMWVAAGEQVQEPSWIPASDGATVHLRVAARGTLEELERRYNGRAIATYTDVLVDTETDSDPERQAVAKRRLTDEFPTGEPPRLRPQLSLYQGYARAISTQDSVTAPGTVFSPYPLVLTLETDGAPYAHLDLNCVLALTTRWREAVLSKSSGLTDRIRQLLSGHNADGTSSAGPHLAFMPLAFVGHAHADGRLLGMALTLPVDVSTEERRYMLRAIGQVRHLVLGGLGRWKVVPDASASPPMNLRPATWTAHPDGATHWASVTPIVFDRHPKATERSASMKEAADMVATACERISLPAPREVIVTSVSPHVGAPPAFEFPRLQRKDCSERRHAHAIVVFHQPVRGPVLIGAGRFRGYGLCRPLNR